jgi:hypothetical protein
LRKHWARSESHSIVSLSNGSEANTEPSRASEQLLLTAIRMLRALKGYLLSWLSENQLVGKVAADRATLFSFSTNVLQITQAIESVEKLALGRGSASIILVFNGTGAMGREPLTDFRFPAVMQGVSGLEAPGGVLDVLEGRIVLPQLRRGDEEGRRAGPSGWSR